MVASSGKEASSNAGQVHTYDPGMCQKFTRESWEVGSLYGSAIDAWEGAREKHKGDRNPPVGAPCYYSGGKYGHAVVSRGGGRIRSTDSPTTGQVNDQALDWPERNWGFKYLGWTGDINGVDCPNLGEEEDDMDLNDKMDEWSPADGTSQDKVTVGYTLRQARGYAEDAYQRVGKLAEKVDAMQADINAILKKLS